MAGEHAFRTRRRGGWWCARIRSSGHAAVRGAYGRHERQLLPALASARPACSGRWKFGRRISALAWNTSVCRWLQCCWAAVFTIRRTRSDSSAPRRRDTRAPNDFCRARQPRAFKYASRWIRAGYLVDFKALHLAGGAANGLGPLHSKRHGGAKAFWECPPVRRRSRQTVVGVGNLQRAAESVLDCASARPAAGGHLLRPDGADR